jgi:hypothetical protein
MAAAVELGVLCSMADSRTCWQQQYQCVTSAVPFGYP